MHFLSNYFQSYLHTSETNEYSVIDLGMYGGPSVPSKKYQRTNGPVNAHLSLLHIPINMFEYYGI